MTETVYGITGDSQRIELFAEDGVRLQGWYRPVRGLGRRGATPAPTDLAYAVAHGFTGSSSGAAVRAICERLAGRGAAVIALDFRGHGGSGGQTSIGVDEQLDLAAGVDFLTAQGFSRICIAGWSMGGSVVVRHAALRGGVAAAVSVSSPGLWYERGTTPMRRVHLAAETRSGRSVARWALRTRIGLTGWDDLPPSPVELAGHIAPIPFLVVHGDQDPYFPRRHGAALAAAAPGSTFWLERGMGHAETATSAELVDRIDAWVRRVT